MRSSQDGSRAALKVSVVGMKDPVDLEGPLLSTAISGSSTHPDVPWDAATCPLGVTIDAIGGRWKLHILRALLLSGPFRYNALLTAVQGISAKELTRNLRELEASRLIERTALNGHAAYALTSLGEQLHAPFRALGMFGAVLAQQRSMALRG